MSVNYHFPVDGSTATQEEDYFDSVITKCPRSNSVVQKLQNDAEFQIQFRKDDEDAWKTMTVVPAGMVDSEKTIKFRCIFLRVFDLTIGSQRSFETPDRNTAHPNDITLPSDKVDRVQLILDPSDYCNVNNAQICQRHYLKACILFCGGSKDIPVLVRILSFINTSTLMVRDVSNKNKPECVTYFQVPNHRTAGPNVYLVSSEAQRLNTSDHIQLKNVIRFQVEHTGTLEGYLNNQRLIPDFLSNLSQYYHRQVEPDEPHYNFLCLCYLLTTNLRKAKILGLPQFFTTIFTQQQQSAPQQMTSEQVTQYSAFLQEILPLQSILLKVEEEYLHLTHGMSHFFIIHGSPEMVYQIGRINTLHIFIDESSISRYQAFLMLLNPHNPEWIICDGQAQDQATSSNGTFKQLVKGRNLMWPCNVIIKLDRYEFQIKRTIPKMVEVATYAASKILLMPKKPANNKAKPN